MSDKTKFSVILLSVFTIFTICYFAIPYNYNNETVHALNYVFAIIPFLFQVYVFYDAFYKSTSLKQKVYGLPIMIFGYSYLVLGVVLSIIINVFNATGTVKTWVVIVIPLIIFATCLIGLFIRISARDYAYNLDNNNQSKTSFMDNLKINIKTLNNEFDYEPLKKQMNELCELIVYSDPIQTDKTQEIDDEIDKEFVKLKESSIEDEYIQTEKSIKIISNLVNERNLINKANK